MIKQILNKKSSQNTFNKKLKVNKFPITQKKSISLYKTT